jgi:hypothetical protein
MTVAGTDSLNGCWRALSGSAPISNPMMELVTGTFARRGERDAFDAFHPLSLLWRQAFAREVAAGDPYSL